MNKTVKILVEFSKSNTIEEYTLEEERLPNLVKVINGLGFIIEEFSIYEHSIFVVFTDRSRFVRMAHYGILPSTHPLKC